MNWGAIKHIYISILVWGAKVKYIGKDRYIIIRFYPSGKKRTQTEYKNGIIHGKCLGWYENGSKQWEIGYKNTKLHGKYRLWLVDGSLNLDYQYENGVSIKYV